MGRELLTQDINKIVSGAYSLDLLDGANHEIEIEGNVNLLITEINKDSNVLLHLKEDAKLVLSILSKNSIENIKFNANLDKNSAIDVYFADFSEGKGKLNFDINLNKEGALADWHLASLAAKNDDKEFEVSIYHNAPNTEGHTNNYGVSKDDAKLVFSGISRIYKYSVKSKTSQNGKIMVFDRNSKGNVKPILGIDENDVQANHALKKEGAIVSPVRCKWAPAN